MGYREIYRSLWQIVGVLKLYLRQFDSESEKKFGTSLIIAEFPRPSVDNLFYGVFLYVIVIMREMLCASFKTVAHAYELQPIHSERHSVFSVILRKDTSDVIHVERIHLNASVHCVVSVERSSSVLNRHNRI